MRVLVTGSSGHLGEALVRTLRGSGHEVVGLDVTASPFTTHVGSIADRGCIRHGLRGVGAVLHTATLHKPHLATHSRQDFIDTNITGTLTLLEEAVSAGVAAFLPSYLRPPRHAASPTSTSRQRGRRAAGRAAAFLRPPRRRFTRRAVAG